MIERLADITAAWMKELVPEHPASVGVLKYGLHIIYNTLLTLVLCVAPALVLGQTAEVLVALAAFASLRAISGGFHFASPVACAIASSVTMLLLSYVQLEAPYMFILTAISVVFAAIYAPSNIEEQTRIPKRYFRHLKIASILLISSNFLIMSPIIAAAFAVQSISLVRRR